MTDTIKLVRCELKYTPISPFRMTAVFMSERERYIEEELGGTEPTPPTYEIKYGGGKLPNGEPLPAWTEEQDYTDELIGSLQEELAVLLERQSSPGVYARISEIEPVLKAWNLYHEQLKAIGDTAREKKYRAALWHAYKDNLPDNDDWIAELAEDGVDVGRIPDNKRERLVFWLENIAVSTQDEFYKVLYTATQQEHLLLEVKQARQTARRIFQRAMEQPRRSDD